MAHNPRVVIIGSGAAGYSAACKLLEHGYSNVIILEAENRIGGRINSVPFGTEMIDLGAQWCHGEKDNIVYSMVKDLNLLEHSQCDFQKFTFLDSRGNYADKNITVTLLNLLSALSEDTDQLKAFNGSFGDYIIKKYEEKLNSEHPGVNLIFAKQILEWFHKLENNENASPNWFEVSTKGLADYLECEGDHVLSWKGKGFKTIFSVLKKEIPDPSKKISVDEKILFNKEVTKIVWHNPNKQQNKELSVECTDGSQYKADHVIITVSLGVLKHLHNTLFVPEIPLYKKNAIQGISFGCINKIILKFPTQWWSANNKCGFDFLWIDEDRDKIITEFPEGPNKDGKSWLTAFFGFHPIESNILLGFVNGEFCGQIESLSDDLVIRGCMYLLRKFVGKHYDIPMPDSILRSSWTTNNHFRGSYSFHSLETVRLNTSASELAKPLGENSLLFAGEATHPNMYASVHGAIDTGFREAQRIISHYQSQTNIKAHV